MGKVVLTNSCSPDSLLTILACVAADSKVFFTFLSRKYMQDNTAKFIIDMLLIKTKKKYVQRTDIVISSIFFIKGQFDC